MSPQWQTSTPMTFFKYYSISPLPRFFNFLFFYKLLINIWNTIYIVTIQLCSSLLSIFSYILHPVKAGIFIYFVDELMHTQQWCAGACLDHILGANYCKSALTFEFSKGALIAWNLLWWETSPSFVYPTSEFFSYFLSQFL